MGLSRLLGHIFQKTAIAGSGMYDQPLTAFLAFWRRFCRTVLTWAALASMVSSVFLSMFSQ